MEVANRIHHIASYSQAEMAEAMKIPPDKLRWYAAFHDAGHHPHIHVMLWSEDPKYGFLCHAMFLAYALYSLSTLLKVHYDLSLPNIISTHYGRIRRI